jgi:hypothetical protein
MIHLFSPLEQFSILEYFTLFFQLKIIALTLSLDISITLFLLENINNFIVSFILLTLFAFYLN